VFIASINRVLISTSSGCIQTPLGLVSDRGFFFQSVSSFLRYDLYSFKFSTVILSAASLSSVIGPTRLLMVCFQLGASEAGYHLELVPGVFYGGRVF